VSRDAKKNMAASVHRRLLNVSRERKYDFSRLCIRYASERLLYRVSVSEYADRFILKGAMLFAVWSDSPHRTTRDIDLLAYGNAIPDHFLSLCKSVCELPVPDDGLMYDTQTIQIQTIREPDNYGGFRIRMYAYLGSAQIPVQIDIGFGDVVTPEAQSIDYPTILDLPAPRLKAYPPETVIAEKFHTLVKLGMANSRMKDFYDLYIMSRLYELNQNMLSKAILATFERRNTEITDELPLALTRKFAVDEDKSKQWRSFLNKNNLHDTPEDFGLVIGDLREYFSKVISFKR